MNPYEPPHDDLVGRVDAVVRAGLTRSGTPGAVVRVARDGAVLLRHAWGSAQTHDEHGPLQGPVPMRVDTLVDVASLTKVAATTAVAMVLVQQGLDLSLPVGRIVPELRPAARDVSLGQLLEHSSGLPDWLPLFLHADEPGRALHQLCAADLVSPPGTTRVYSDVGMALLGIALERLGGSTLNDLAGELVHRPLGMRSTTYRPTHAARERCAATSTGNPVERRMLVERYPHLAGTDIEGLPWWRPRTLLGEVNDANAAAAFVGVAGHAGLFSTIDDLGAMGEELERAARGVDGALFTSETVGRFTTPGAHEGQGLGFWTGRIVATPGVGHDGPDPSFGHRGFTGCELLMSPMDRLVIVLLSNRLHGGDPPPAHDLLWRPVLKTVLSSVRRPS